MPVPSPNLTTVADSLFDENGQPVNGKIYVVNTSTMVSPDGYEIPEGTNLWFPVVNGAFSFGLVPNINSTPAGTSYAVKYQVSSQWFNEVWIVPQTPNPCKLTDVRSLKAPIPDIMIPVDQVLPPSDAIPGEALVWTSNGWITSSAVGTFTPFSEITTETNSTATMTVKSGASIIPDPLVPGVIDATTIQGVPVATNTPTEGNLLIFDPIQSKWVPGDPKVQGLVSEGSSLTGINPVAIGGKDGSGNNKYLILDSSGRPTVNIAGGSLVVTQSSGTNLHVNVDNFPSVGSDVSIVSPVDGSGNVKVNVINLPSPVTVTGSVAISNFPSSQNVVVTNLPGTQPVSGTVTAKIQDSAGNTINSSGHALNVNVVSGGGSPDVTIVEPTDGSGNVKVVVQNLPATQPVSIAAIVNVQDVADGVPGSAVPTKATQVAGSDGIALRPLKTDSLGVLQVTATNTLTPGFIPDRQTSGAITSTQNTVISTQGASTVILAINGTWTGTIVFESTVDGSIWEPCMGYPLVLLGMPAPAGGSTRCVSGTGETSQWAIPVGGFFQFRVRGASVASGTADIALEAGAGLNTVQIVNNQDAPIFVEAAGGSFTPPANGVIGAPAPTYADNVGFASHTGILQGVSIDNGLPVNVVSSLLADPAEAVPGGPQPTKTLSIGTTDAFNNLQPVSATHPLPITGSISASNPSVGTDNTPAPSSSTQIGTQDIGGKLQAVSATNPLPITGSISATNPSVGTTGSAVPASATTVGGTDGTNLRAFLTDTSGQQKVLVQNFPATQPVSAVSLPLPTGAATVAKQPALGTAGSASADVITVQGIASMTALKVDGSGVIQPVSGTVAVSSVAGTVAATQSGTWNIATVTAVTAITNALPAGTNVLGHVISDTGSTTAVTGNVTVVQPTASNLNATVSFPSAQHVIVDSGAITVSGSVTANIGTTGGLALDATLTGGTAKTLVYDGTNTVFTSSHPGYVQFGSAQAVTLASTTITGSVAVTGTVAVSNLFALDATVANVQGSPTGGTAATKSSLSGGIYNVTPPSLTDGQQCGLQLDSSGKLQVNATFGGVVSQNLTEWAGVTLGSSAVVNYGSTPAATAVQGVNAFVTNTVTVSGTVAATQSGNWTTRIVGAGGITLDAVLGATKPANVLQVGGNDGTNAYGIPLASGGASVVVSGTVTTTPPSNASTNIAQINGTTPLMGNGTTGTGSQRVTIASDNTAFSVNAVESGTWTVQVGNTANTTPILANPAPTTSGGLGLPFSSSVTVKAQVKGSAGNVYGWSILNNTAAIAYCQVFNLASASVTLGSTTPDYVIGIPANSTTGAGTNVLLPIPISHSTGITVACTTTRTGSTTAACDVLFFYN